MNPDFEKYGQKKELMKRDFMRMYADKIFREHLWRKEIGYYKELVQIVENLKLIRFYGLLAMILFVGVAWLEVFFAVVPFKH